MHVFASMTHLVSFKGQSIYSSGFLKSVITTIFTSSTTSDNIAFVDWML